MFTKQVLRKRVSKTNLIASQNIHSSPRLEEDYTETRFMRFPPKRVLPLGYHYSCLSSHYSCLSHGIWESSLFLRRPKKPVHRSYASRHRSMVRTGIMGKPKAKDRNGGRKRHYSWEFLGEASLAKDTNSDILHKCLPFSIMTIGMRSTLAFFLQTVLCAIPRGE